MPFLIYNVERKENDRIYSLSKRTSSLPKIMKQYVTGLSSKESGDVVTWHLNEADFLMRLGLDDKVNSIIVDLKPSQKEAVSLYKLAGVWGYSGYGWTPLLVLLETFFVDHKVLNPSTFKQKFNLSLNLGGDKVHEFLYLRFDQNGGNANWGRSGWVNASLLWPEPLRYFMGVIKKNLEKGDSFELS